MPKVVRASLMLAMFVIAPIALAQDSEPPNDGRYMIKFRDLAGAAQTVAALGGRPVLELVPQSVIAAYLSDQALQGLRNHPNVEYIEIDPRRYPMAQTTPYGIKMVQADQVSDSSAAGRKVCIIDSGYSLGHEDLDGDSSVSGVNDSGTGNWFVDNCGHGTHVAGTVSALNNGVGVVGVMPSGNINLHIIKVFGDDCSWTYSSDLINALNKCRNASANVVSMSLGCTGMFCRSSTEENAFNDAYSAGVLSIAAAGNSGNTQVSYPAGYASVVSVAAVDSAKVVASFSQQNSDVELAAPGVAVRSTVPTGTGVDESLTVDAVVYEAVGMQNSPNGTGSGPLVDCGRGTADCVGATGAVCLIERGEITFDEKARNCQDGGGVAAVIYNNAAALFSGTLGDSPTSSIPTVGVSGTDGQVLKTKIGTPASVTTATGGNYAFFDGTSMATPHVSGVAALVWSHVPTRSNDEIRQALQATAEDLGAAGRDNAYGYGLVRAKAALDRLLGGGGGCTPTESPETSCSDGVDNDCDGVADGADTDCQTSTGITLSATGYKVKGLQKADLTWSGATSTNVDVFRNGANITTTANDGFHTDNINNRGGGSYTYKVCEAGTTTCSNEATISF
jgi:serine protease